MHTSQFSGFAMNNNNLENYFRNQQVSLQWLAVLRAMALELSASASPVELRLLFSKIGTRFANEVQEQFMNVNTLAELEEGLNVFWAQINWGWVNLTDAGDSIGITHQAAPLAEAFGDESLSWCVGLLEGFYHNIFSVLGASAAMQVRDTGESDAMTLRLRFELAVN
ncbi:MAG: hypothetical protein GW907_00675 [Betaproteobacteria bacterium]|nr:hypothetical protein [Betaproteobacteria bacterium]NCP82496.1 hypothetical protein [Rhodoferax sp.]